MSNLRKKQPITPYVRSPRPRELAEDVGNAMNQYGGNKYEMVIIAAARARQIYMGDPPKVPGNHRAAVTALLEIEAGFYSAKSK